MKLSIILILLQLSIFSQDRTTIYNTGSPPIINEGHGISINQSMATRFTVSNNYVLEAIVFYISLQSEQGNLIVSIREDNNGIPGELVSELSQWNHTLDPFNLTGYNLITATDLCIYLDSDSPYWLRIDAADANTQAVWSYSSGTLYTYSQNTNQSEWVNNIGQTGASGIWAEQIYENPYQKGDVNFDFLLNVTDIIAIISHIIGNNLLNDEQLSYGDLNSDGVINVSDIVQLVNHIIQAQDQNPNFSLRDINPASEFYNLDLGPSFFNGQVSCYYFAKQGWGLCKHRFGVINDLYNDLLSDGITDVKMMGVNGYQYIEDSLDCMICDDPCESSTCDNGPRILPWTQDYDDGINCNNENSDLCIAGDNNGDVWDLWDISLRDFIILDRYGVEFTRINLTPNNPDPTDLGECSGNYQKIKDLILAARNR